MDEPKPKKVVLALIEKNGEFLLIERRIPQRKLVWSFPGGVVEDDDLSYEDAVKREAKEEVGLDVEVIEKLFERKHPETFVQLVYFYCRPIGGNEGVGTGQESEIKEIKWVPVEKVLDYFTSDVSPTIRKFITSRANKKETT